MAPGVLVYEGFDIGFGIPRKVSVANVIKLIELLSVEPVYSSVFSGDYKHAPTLIKGSVNFTLVETLYGI